MPRKPRLPKPWPRMDRGGDWYVKIQGKPKLLAPAGATPHQVQTALLSLLTKADAVDRKEAGPVLPHLEKYLEYVRDHQKPKTFRVRQRELRSFAAYLKETGNLDLAVQDLKPYHVTEWLNARSNRGPSSRRISIGSLLAGLNWAKHQGYIDLNPLEGRIKQPSPVSRGREAVMDEATYQEWLGFCRLEEHRHILMGLYRSGCRPGEVTSLGVIEGTGFNEAAETWTVCGKATAANPTGFRTVNLPPVLVELSKELRSRHPEGALFRNSRGRPWDGTVLAQTLRGFRRKSMKLHPDKASKYEKLVPYSGRHSLATALLRQGWSETQVAQHLGHKGTGMLHKHYAHLTHEDVRPMIQSVVALPDETVRAKPPKEDNQA